MQDELTSQLTNGILPAIIALLFAAILSMLIGYQTLARMLIKIGMKKGDAKALGQTVAVMMFLVISAIYFKFAILG